MIRTDPQTLYLWQVRARPAWYQMPDGGLMLEYTAMKSPIFTAGVGWAFSISCLFQWFFVRLEATVQTPVVGGQSDTTCTGSPTSCRPPAGGRPTGIGHETRRNHHRRAAQGHRDAVCAARPVCLSGDGPRDRREWCAHRGREHDFLNTSKVANSRNPATTVRPRGELLNDKRERRS